MSTGVAKYRKKPVEIEAIQLQEHSAQEADKVKTVSKGNLVYEPTQPYTGVRQWEAVGAWIGVVTCMTCGAGLIVDPGDEGLNVFKIHDRWHFSLDAMHGWANTTEGQAEVTVRRQT